MLKTIIANIFQDKTVFFVIYLWFFSFQAFAQTTSCNKPAVYYVNGVNTSLTGSHDGANELTAAIAETFPSYGISVRTIYNPSESILGDAAEVAVTQNWLRIGMDFVVAITALNSPNFSEWLQKELDDVAANIRRTEAIEDIKSIVLAQINASSAPVILIAHSQGNIMVNEAVRQLKTNSITASIPGVKTIAVLGIAVADKINMFSLMDNTNYHLYNYITATTDLIIGALQGVPAANYSTGFLPSGGLQGGGHFLIGTYLNKYWPGIGSNERPTRSVVVGYFDDLYHYSAKAWPCFVLSSDPNSSAIGEEVTFTMKATDRLTGAPVSLPDISLLTDDSSSSPLLCSGTVDNAGNPICIHTFLAPIRTEKLRIQYKPVELPIFISNKYIQIIAEQPYKFEVAQSTRPEDEVLYCEWVAVGWGYSYETCKNRKSAVISCIGRGCTPGRFFASIIKSQLTTYFGCVVVGVCQPSSDTSSYGAPSDLSQAVLFSPEKIGLWWFPLEDGGWIKAWGSVSSIAPNIAFDRNLTIYDRQLVDQYALDLGLLKGGSLDVTYNIYDTFTGNYYNKNLVVTVP